MSHKARGSCSLIGLSLCQINPLIKSHYPLIKCHATVYFIGVISVHHLLSQNVSITVTIDKYKFNFNRLLFIRICLLSLLLADSLCQYNTYDYYGSGSGSGDGTTATYPITDSITTNSDYPDTAAPTRNPPVIITNPPPQTTLQPASPSLSGRIKLVALIKYA